MCFSGLGVANGRNQAREGGREGWVFHENSPECGYWEGGQAERLFPKLLGIEPNGAILRLR